MPDLIMFRKTAILGGGATDLDGISATALVGEELCWVTVSDVKSLYRLNATSGAAADGVNIVIPVVGTVGNKRWILQSDKVGSGTVYADHIAEGTAVHGVNIDGVILKDSLVYTNTTGVVDVAAGSTIDVNANLTVNNATTLTGSPYTPGGTDVAVADGGTGVSTLTTAYGLLAAGTTATGNVQTIAAGATTQILVGGGASALPAWGTDIPTAVTIGSAYIHRVGGTDVTVADGGTGVSTFALNGVLFGNAANAIGVTAIGAAGNLLKVGASPFVPAWSSLVLTEGANTFNLTLGTASLDVAAGAAVNIDEGLTVTKAATLTTELHVTAPATHIADAATGFTIAGGTTSKTLTVPEDVNLGGVLRTNLLTNSQFMAMSGSSVENVRTLPDATSVATGTSIASTAHAFTTADGVGKLVKDAANVVFEVMSVTNVDTFVVDRTGWTDGQAYEVTPGYVAADYLAPDGWIKDTSQDLWREHSGTNTTGGSFYSLKVTSGSSGDLIYSPGAPPAGSVEYAAKFAGRTVTFGCWVKSDAASQVRIGIRSTANTWTSYNVGAGWEWLEVTYAVPAAVVLLQVVLNVINTKTAYFSQPMLAFSSSLGQGNYAPAPSERILSQAKIPLTGYAATTGAADAIINLEAASSGMIGKGVKSVLVKAYGKDSAAGDGVGFDVQSASTVEDGISVDTQVNNVRIQQQGWVKCDANGDIYFDHRGSGAAALTVNIEVIGIEP
jgi:hypothetical protein